MKLLAWTGVFLIVMLLAGTDSSEAFSRRSSHSDMAQPAPATTNLSSADRTGKSTINGLDVSPQAVPEPPVLWLMSLGVGLLAGGVIVRGLRRPTGSSR